jgi:hypothetical protein
LVVMRLLCFLEDGSSCASDFSCPGKQKLDALWTNFCGPLNLSLSLSRKLSLKRECCEKK